MITPILLDPAPPKTEPTERKSLIIIPARMDSNRLPGKPLLMAGGKALVHWTYDRAFQTKADYVLVTSPDREVCRHCQDNGIPWRPTSKDFPNGTSRCADVLEQMGEKAEGIDVVVNWQVDEPLVIPTFVDHLIDQIDLFQTRGIEVLTLVAPSTDDYVNDYNVTKVAVGHDYNCYWFSRAPMAGSMVHCGVYAFCTDDLQVVGKWGSTDLSKAESLEQLTWIELGVDVFGVEMEKLPLGINAREDWLLFKSMVENRA